MAIGTTSKAQPCTGYYADRREKVQTIIGLLADTQSYRPTTLWMAGKFVDRGTAGLAPNARHAQRHLPGAAHLHS